MAKKYPSIVLKPPPPPPGTKWKAATNTLLGIKYKAAGPYDPRGLIDVAIDLLMEAKKQIGAPAPLSSRRKRKKK